MKFALSCQQRLDLAVLFLNQHVKLSGAEDIKLFNRTRLALGLAPIMPYIGTEHGVDEELMVSDTQYAFELDKASVDFVLTRIVTLPDQPSYLAVHLGEFYEALEAAKLTGAAPPVDASLADGNEACKFEKWKGRNAEKRVKCPGCKGTGYLVEEKGKA